MSESDDDFGPQQADQAASVNDAEGGRMKKRRRIGSEWEDFHLQQLPTAEYYEHSYMHRDVVTHIAISKATEFVITGSFDGHVKFWKKMSKGIEFVKHYQAHLGQLHSMVVSTDEKQLVTTSSDQMIKFFEIVGFDMSNMLSVDYVPFAAVWLSGPKTLCDRVAVSDKNSGKIRIYKSTGNSEPLHELSLHSSPVICMGLNSIYGAVVSIDTKGIIEYWDIDSFSMPSSPVITFKYKTDTGLYDLAKARTIPCTVAVASKGKYFATFSRDKQIRVFDFASGKLIRKYDENINVYAVDNVPYDELELGRKQAVERELDANFESLSTSNIVFDDSNQFLLFATLKGIKVVSIASNKIVRIIGQPEKAERFLSIALYQGIPTVDQQFLLSRQEMSTTKTDNVKGLAIPQKTSEEILEESNYPDPTIFCTSFKRRRFYCFSNRDPEESVELRDKFNELPTEEERVQVTEQSTHALPGEAILHTTFGDIVIKLYHQECPKTVENFTTHINNHYYDNIIFHRVIKGFMIQTGDPLGDGTGGESIWGKEFEDEFVRTLRHDRPFTVSMANAGPNTNGSQFFITTVPTPWLDNKHTVFGRVVKGFEVVSKIESLKVNKLDKPYESVKIITAETL